jgi:hypothetical protein
MTYEIEERVENAGTRWEVTFHAVLRDGEVVTIKGTRASAERFIAAQTVEAVAAADAARVAVAAKVAACQDAARERREYREAALERNKREDEQFASDAPLAGETSPPELCFRETRVGDLTPGDEVMGDGADCDGGTVTAIKPHPLWPGWLSIVFDGHTDDRRVARPDTVVMAAKRVG